MGWDGGGLLGLQGVLDDNGDVELVGSAEERLVSAVCGDKVPTVEDLVDIIGVTVSSDERIEKAWEHRFRIREVEGKEGNCISSSSGL